MPQYVTNPTDPTQSTAINLIQPRDDGAYPLITVEVSQRANRYVAHVDDKEYSFEILPGEGQLEGILPHVRQQRQAVVLPEREADAAKHDSAKLPILAVQKAEGSRELLAIRRDSA